MIFYVYCSPYDSKLNQHHFFSNPNIQRFNLRSVFDEMDCYASCVLLSYHGTNQKIIQLIRSSNVLIPIYIISDFKLHISGINGTIHPNELTIDHLTQLSLGYPQRHIWNYVFKQDFAAKQIKLICA
ncbi:MAG: hypothetical protein VW397_05165 [Candidatus Margulisiibacteriota bacterium]